jgi:hypothetical protein
MAVSDHSPRDIQINLSEYFITGVNTYLNEIQRNRSAIGGRRDLTKYVEYGNQGTHAKHG